MGRWLRRLLIGGGVLLGLPLLLVAAMLAEAHLEMQRVAPPIPQRGAIEAALADGGPVRLHYVNSGTQGRPDGRRSTYGGFLLEWADGRTFLVDVGMDREATKAFGRTMERVFGADPVRAHGSAGERLGAAATRIEGVGFTHLHSDHTQGMAELCRAIGHEVPVFQTPDQHARDNFWTRGGREEVAGAGCARFEGLGASLQAVPGFPGLVAMAAGGHTPGSTVWFADVAGTRFALAGDITNAKANLTSDTPKSPIYSLFIVPENRGRLGELRRWLAALESDAGYRVVVSHDLDAIEAAGVQSWR